MKNPIDPDWLKDHHDELITYALKYIGDQEQAENLVQATFLLAIASQATFSSLKARQKWLNAILKNKVADFLSKSSMTH